jgi:hypothetical protein
VGVNVKGLGLSTSSNCERLDVGLVLGNDDISEIRGEVVARLGEYRGDSVFFVKRPRLSLLSMLSFL